MFSYQFIYCPVCEIKQSQKSDAWHTQSQKSKNWWNQELTNIRNNVLNGTRPHKDLNQLILKLANSKHPWDAFKWTKACPTPSHHIPLKNNQGETPNPCEMFSLLHEHFICEPTNDDWTNQGSSQNHQNEISPGQRPHPLDAPKENPDNLRQSQTHGKDFQCISNKWCLTACT